jgi:hypothetical protein
VRFGHRCHGLLANMGQKFAVVAKDQSARIHHPQAAPIPLHLLVEAIPRYAGLVVDNGRPYPRHAIDEAGLAHVGATHNSY